MANSINTNISALYAQANITAAANASTSEVARLSSGNRIIQASDDVAALAIGTSLGSLVGALKTAQTNASQGSSLLQVADGALSQIQSILQQQQSVANQAQSGSLTDTDRGFLNQEFQALTSEINALATSTTFNGVNLIDGSIAAGGTNGTLNNTAITTAATADASAGTNSSTTGSATVGAVNFTGFTDTSTNANAGTTQYSGFTNAAAGFTNTTVTTINGVNDPNFTAAGTSNGNTLAITGSTTAAVTTFGNSASGTNTSTGYAITYTINGVAYTGSIAANTHGVIAAGASVTLIASGNDSQITLTVGASNLGTVDASNVTNDAVVLAALTANLANAKAYNANFATGVTISQPNPTTNDTALYGALAGGAGGGTFSVVGNGTGTGGLTGMTAYNVTYNINGITYTGSLGNNGGTGGHTDVAAGTALQLTATTNPTQHATINFTTGVNSFGTDTSTGQSANIAAALNGLFASATGTAGSFQDNTNAAGLITAASGGATDAHIYGDLSNGAIDVYASTALGTVGTVGTGGNALGYTVTYTLNGQVYKGFVNNENIAANANGSAGQGNLGAAKTITLSIDGAGTHTATDNIVLKTGTAFGISSTAGETVDQSANIKAALQAYLTGANVLNTTASAATASATLGGLVTTAGVGNAVANNDVATNDTALVGALSAGTFAVSGNTTNGYSVSYTLGGSIYQGTLSAAEITHGSTLVLDNGKGNLSFAITASTVASPNAATATASALQTALTTQFSAATAYAIHQVASTAVGGNSATAITAASTTGTQLAGLTGANVKLQSALFSGVDLPSVSTFSGTGSGATTTMSVLINGVSYSTTGAVTPNGASTVTGSTWNGGTGILVFYKGGDTTSKEKLTLDLSAITGGAQIGTTAEVSSFASALNSAFGSGGSSGGLTFQLGSTTTSNVTVNIGSAKTSSLFGGASLDVSNATDAATATAAVTTALNTITSLRAGVGALETQFNFAAAALQSSVQNEGAAQSSLLDTDIAASSTNFSADQVKLQAGISVLAQANQQLQALLKTDRLITFFRKTPGF